MLNRKNRLLTNYEFGKARRIGTKYSSSSFDMYILDANNYDGPPKIGIVVSARIDKTAVKRNRVKRVFREAIRENLTRFKYGYWIAIYPNKSSLEKGYEEINTEFTKVLQNVSFSG